KQRFPTPEVKTAQKAAKPAKEQPEKKGQEQPKQDGQGKAERTEEALRSTRITRDFVGVSLSEFVVTLRKACDVQIAVDQEIKADELKVSVKGDSRSAEKVLDEALSSLGLGRSRRDDICYITTAERAQEPANNFGVW